MGIFSDLTDRFLVAPFAKRVLEVGKVQLDSTQNQAPSQFAIPIGYNTTNIDNNRRTSGQTVTYSTLRQISIAHETSRAAINARKRQITQLDFDIVDAYPDTGKSYSDDERLALIDQFKHIGGDGVRFRELLDRLIEDALVLDGLCFYKQRTVGGKLLRIIPIDAATIKLRVDEQGLTPLPPEIAYEQWIRGSKVADMTTQDMEFHCMNRRTTSPYGLSPLESLVITVDASLRAALYNSNYLSDNNIPEGFISMPPEWTPAQIKEYMEYFDTLMSGPKAQSKVRPIPAGAEYQPTTKPKDFRFGEFLDYLDRHVAMLFDITPQELGLSLQQYKENADAQEKIGQRKGLKPLAHFLEEIFTDLIRKEWGYLELAFKFKGLDSKYSTEERHQLIADGVISIDDVRNDIGEKALGVGNVFIVGNQVIPVEQVFNPTTVSGNQTSTNSKTPSVEVNNAPAQNKQSEMSSDSEMKMWEAKSINDIKKKGKIYREFHAALIDPLTQKVIRTDLSKAHKVEDVHKIFKLAKVKVNNPITALLTDPKAKKMHQMIAAALKDQLKPFTNAAAIGRILEAKKIDDSDIADGVDEELDSADFENIDDYLKWAAEGGGQHAYDSIGIDSVFTLTNPKFADMLGSRSNYLINSVNETTKQWLVDQIAAGKAQGLTNDEIAKQISDNMDEISATRADTIVNTEVANACQTAELDTYHDQGITQKIWVLSEDIGDECGENADQGAIGVDDVFSSGDDAPPAHPNCRCFIQAVFDNGDTSYE